MARAVAADSNRLAYWQCLSKKKHVFRTRVSARTAAPNGQGCPACYAGRCIDLNDFPQAAAQFDRSARNFGFDSTRLPEDFKIFWQCRGAQHYRYETFAELRARDWQCPQCLSEKDMLLSLNYPELGEQIVPGKNIRLLDLNKVRSGSNKIVAWQCPAAADHVWEAPIYARTLHGENCPFCANRRPSTTNNLANFSDIAKELHPTKNGNVTADKLVASSTRNCWWLCSLCRHEWQRPIRQRTQRGSRCPLCKGTAAANAAHVRQLSPGEILNQSPASELRGSVRNSDTEADRTLALTEPPASELRGSVRNSDTEVGVCRGALTISQPDLHTATQVSRFLPEKISQRLKAPAIIGWLRARALIIIAAICTVMCLIPQASLAQPVTYTQADFNTGAAGSFSFASGSPPVYTIEGAGTGIAAPGYDGDSLSFVSTAACGNIEFECEVSSQGATGSGAQAGLMIRYNSWDPRNTNACCAIAVTPGDGVNFYYRDINGINTIVSGPAVAAPVYLRLVRSGSTISGYYSTTGLGNWTLVGSHTVSAAIPTLYYAGFFVSSSVSGTLNTSVFENVAYMTSVPQQSSNLLQWLRSDVGVTSSSGSVSSWSDQSGNGNDAAQSSGTLQPAVVAGAINNAVLPTVTFDGSTEYMTIASDFADLTAGSTIFAVLEPTSASATGTPCAYGNSSNSDAIFPQTVGTQAKLNAYNSSTASSVATTDNPLSNSSYQLLEETFQPGSSADTGIGTIYVNGTQQAQSTSMVENLNNTTRSSNTLGVGIGLNDYFQGGIAEVLVFNTPLSDSARHSVESYILSKYNIGTEPTLDAPTFTPGSGVFAPIEPGSIIENQTVTPSQDQGGVVFYTTDGTTPSPTSSLFYNNIPITLNQTQTIKGIAMAPFFNNSSVTTSTYQVDAGTIPVSRDGLVMWLRADNSVSTSGTNVTQWSDVSGSGNNASQSTSADQPTLLSNALNGLPALQFNGTSQFLQLPAGMSDFSSGASIFIVAEPTAVTAGARFLDLGNGSASDNLLLQEPSSSAAALYVYNGSSSSNVTASSGVTLNQYQLLEAVYDGTNTATISTNGVQDAQSASMNSINNLLRSSNYIGQGSAGGNYFQGQIAEVLLYDRAVTSSEQAAIEGYLLGKYQALSSNSTPAPTISVAAGALSGPTQVAIEAPAAATVFFTCDGTDPTPSSNTYLMPINVAYSQTVKAIAVVNGVSSSVVSAAYTLDSTLYPAPDSGDATPLQINTQLPVNGIPQDSNQH